MDGWTQTGSALALALCPRERHVAPFFVVRYHGNLLQPIRRCEVPSDLILILQIIILRC